MHETILASGHENVSANHTSTLELTTDDWLTEAGDCIVGIEADRAPSAFDPSFVEAARSVETTITAKIAVGDQTETIHGRGDPALTFESDRSAVIRTSGYVDDRTVLVGADAAAADIDRSIIEQLQEGASIELELRIDE